MGKTAGHRLFQNMLPECNTRPASSSLCISDVTMWGKFQTRLTPMSSHDAGGHTPANRMSQRDQRLHRLRRRPPGPASATIAKTVGPVADRTLIDDDQRLLVVASSREDSPAEQALQIVRIRLSLFSLA